MQQRVNGKMTLFGINSYALLVFSQHLAILLVNYRKNIWRSSSCGFLGNVYDA